MNYDEFKQAVIDALRESGLRAAGVARYVETLDLRSTDRTVTTHVEPLDPEIGRPFHVGGTISWCWDALQAARTATTEEDFIHEVLGRDDDAKVTTERPSVRVDIKLRASLPWGKGIPMPSAAPWKKWSREALGRLETVEPLVPEDVSRELPNGRLAILAWQGDPEIKVTCNPAGELRLEGISVNAFQIVELVRQWDDPDREPDEHPHAQLAALFARVRAALHAWGEVMDHLR